MAKEKQEDLDFTNVMGEVFAEILADSGISDASIHDFYSAIFDGTGRRASFDELRAWKSADFALVAAALNKYFETGGITPEHAADAVQATLRRWAG